MVGAVWGILVVSEAKRRLAANLTRIRKDRGFTQDTLAKLIGVSAGMVSHWENPESKVWIGGDNLDAICSALQCDVEDLARRDPESNVKFEPITIPKRLSKHDALKVINQNLGDFVIKLKTKSRRKRNDE